MKRIIIVFLLFFSIKSFAQQSKELLSNPELTWFGLDFSKAKFIGSFATYATAGVKTGQDIKDNYFRGWNDLILKESDKYSFKKAYNKTDVPFDLSIVNKRNKEVDADKIFAETSSDKGQIKKEEIPSIVKNYDSGKSGLGLVYIVDNFDKVTETGEIWVTFFDMNTKNVLYTEKYSGKPGGFGIKNYWAGAILNIIKASGKEWKTLEKKFK